MGAILKSTNGVLNYEIVGENLVKITYDDDRTNLQLITKALERGNFVVEGKAKSVKKNRSKNLISGVNRE